jgi:hypothetical protein
LQISLLLRAWTVNVNSYLKSQFPSNALEPEQCPAGRRKRNRRRNARRFFFSGLKAMNVSRSELIQGKISYLLASRFW